MNKNSLYRSLMIIEFCERFVAFSVKLTILSYVVSKALDGLGYGMFYSGLTYGMMELGFYSFVALYSISGISTYNSIALGAMCMLTGILGICKITNIYAVILFSTILVGGQGLIKSGAMHIISSVHSEYNLRIKKLSTYYAIINIGSCLGGVAGNLLIPLVGWRDLYKCVLVFYIGAFLYIVGQYKKIKTFDLANINVVETEKANINDNYESTWTTFKANWKQLIYLSVLMCTGAINVCFTCSTIPTYLGFCGQSTINIFGNMVPINIIVQINPVIIVIISKIYFGQCHNMSTATRKIKHGLLSCLAGYLIYTLVFFSADQKLLISALSIVAMAASEIFLVICTYNLMISYFSLCKPSALSIIISSTYMLMGITSISVSLIAEEMIGHCSLQYFVAFMIVLISVSYMLVEPLLKNLKNKKSATTG